MSRIDPYRVPVDRKVTADALFRGVPEEEDDEEDEGERQDEDEDEGEGYSE
jgi:hypothetical protein